LVDEEKAGGVTQATNKELMADGATLDAIRAEWNALLPSSVTPYPFQSPDWAAAWLDVLAPDAEPLILSVRDDAGALIGVAPLAIVRTDDLGRAVRFCGGTDVTDYLDVVAQVDDLPRVWAAVVSYFHAHRDGWDALDFHCLPNDSPSRAVLADVLAEMHVRVAREEVCPQVPLHGAFRNYLRALPKKERHEIRRKARNLEQLLPRAQFRVVMERDEALALLPDFFRLHRLSAPDKERFLTPTVERFFARIVAATANGGWLRLYTLTDGTTPIAMMLAFVAGDRLLVYNSGFDPAHRNVSAGMTLTGMMIEHAADAGVAVCDFLRGNESYKYRFGAADVPLWRVLAGSDAAALDRAVAAMEAALQTPADARDRDDDTEITEAEA
jgi:CelD/BcsL family acetyltransferase involved in cellulose biosynthesis